MTTTTATSVQPTVTVTPNSDGTPTIRMDLSVSTADQLLAVLGGKGLDLSDTDLREQILDPLYLAVSEATDFTIADIDGCPGLWPDAAPMSLIEPAVLGNDTGTMLAVLIPGTPGPLDAITLAVKVAREGGADLDPTDPALMAEVHPARWLVLNSCESVDHDFHPELAMLGDRTPGAVLVTQVHLTRN